ncbi:MAG TPA: TetR/AcrR family transcriptional regulator [Solimonas sp.]|nr:TetR/AcrR family transcriptional regulator [Solimonas sp.]
MNSPATPSAGRVGGRPRSAKSEQSIIQTTLRILQEHGYAALTIDRVAASAKVSKSTIYRRWPTKEHLVLAVFERIPLAAAPKGRSLEEDLLTMAAQFTRSMRESPIQSVLPRLAGECVDNPALAEALVRVNTQRREPMRMLLQQAIARGEIEAATNIDLAIDLIQGAIVSRVFLMVEELRPAWIRELVGVLKSGFGRKAPPPRKRAGTAGKR